MYRLAEIRKSLCCYDKREKSKRKLLASEKVTELFKIFNSTSENVIVGPLGLSIDETLIVWIIIK